MLRKYYSKQSFTTIFEEVNKYVDGIHNLNNGINLEDITSLQNELNIQIPDIYKDFLQVCNGGELFIPEQSCQKFIQLLRAQNSVVALSK